MKIAIISDIHGNSVALEAVLEDLARQGNIDHIILSGDFFAFGPAPNDVLTILRQLPNALFLRGNTDRYLLEKSYPTTAGEEKWEDKLLLSFLWTAEYLGDEGVRFLEGLPFFQLIQINERQLLAVHASPRSDEEGLTATTEVEDLREMSISPQVAVLVCGHTHIPMNRMINGLRVVNAGSVGLPFDGDPRACYAVISNLAASDSSAIQLDLRRVTYDVEKAVEQLYASNHPGADIGAYNLRTGQPVGSNLIYTPEMRQNNASS